MALRCQLRLQSPVWWHLAGRMPAPQQLRRPGKASSGFWDWRQEFTTWRQPPKAGSAPQPVGMADLQPLGVHGSQHLLLRSLHPPTSETSDHSPLTCPPSGPQKPPPPAHNASHTPGTPANLGHPPCLRVTPPWTAARPPQEEVVLTARVLCVSCISLSQSLCRVQLFVTPWTCKKPAKQEYWGGLPVPSLGDLPDQGLNLFLLHCRQVLYH